MVVVNTRKELTLTETETLALTVPEAARRLGVGRNTLYNAVKRKEVPHIRIGRRVLIPTSALADFLRTSSQAAA
jgi:excisionase family DNA binding protein